MNRIITTSLFAIALTACGRAEVHALPQPAEPNAVVHYSIDGNYEVSGVSDDKLCVYDDTVWNIEKAGDANVYSVDTALDYSYVRANRALLASDKLTWTESRSYTVSGCNYGTVTTYNAWLDDAGNITGTIQVRPTNGDCVRSANCDYQIVSTRRQ